MKASLGILLEYHPNVLSTLLADIDDEKLTEALKRYHREGKTSNTEIKELLKHELDYDLRCE